MMVLSWNISFFGKLKIKKLMKIEGIEIACNEEYKSVRKKIKNRSGII